MKRSILFVMNKAYLLIGGNLGDREGNLSRARLELEAQAGTIASASGLYATAAWGNTEQPDFLNQALELHTTLNARQLIRRILKIEKQMGRIRAEKFGPRIIDIDILLFNEEVHDIPFLKVPHPELPNRRFALVPLAAIAPHNLHPLSGNTVADLLDRCTDQGAVKLVSLAT
ncbi:MAG: 2-amino-4-hydroxy-6-hydroxymethyldihydropteridine diphosphokinase [Chitinophagaceae bacterium]|nr:2-amino-4-hydroxy-6-hydroxymethyldihydropteridine diphosphokinase [Chitinophagaceae bacterium]